MNPHHEGAARRAGHRCEYCRAPEPVFNFPFEVDHVVPPSREGSDDLTNLALSCRACNLRKSDYVTGIDEETGRNVALFNPRRERWDDHFDCQSDGSIRGRTATGRATVARLSMNSGAQLAARRWWMKLGMFP